jgi:hypothetical protein
LITRVAAIGLVALTYCGAFVAGRFGCVIGVVVVVLVVAVDSRVVVVVWTVGR